MTVEGIFEILGHKGLVNKREVESVGFYFVNLYRSWAHFGRGGLLWSSALSLLTYAMLLINLLFFFFNLILLVVLMFEGLVS